jgi:hypothetical protein
MFHNRDEFYKCVEKELRAKSENNNFEIKNININDLINI